jgi:hypothetical protein
LATTPRGTVPVDAPPATVADAPSHPDGSAPICPPGVYRFECDVLEGDLTHPEGID